MDLRDLSRPSWEEPRPDPSLKPKRKKYGGRKKGSVNKRKLQKIHDAERELREAKAVTGKRPATLFAIDHMDEMITYFRGLVAMHQPWNVDGSKRQGADEKLWLRIVEIFQGWLNMRAPYQSPRLSAIQVVQEPQVLPNQRTTVHVTILNAKGDTVYSDAENSAGDGAKLIEGGRDEEAA